MDVDLRKNFFKMEIMIFLDLDEILLEIEPNISSIYFYYKMV